MIKNTLMFLFIAALSLTVNAEDVESRLLASWGVKETEQGVIYLGYQTQRPLNWVSLPLRTHTVDYSSLPLDIKPLIIYKR